MRARLWLHGQRLRSPLPSPWPDASLPRNTWQARGVDMGAGRPPTQLRGSLEVTPLGYLMPWWWTGSSRPWVGSAEVNEQVRPTALFPAVRDSASHTQLAGGVRLARSRHPRSGQCCLLANRLHWPLICAVQSCLRVMAIVKCVPSIPVTRLLC